MCRIAGPALTLFLGLLIAGCVPVTAYRHVASTPAPICNPDISSQKTAGRVSGVCASQIMERFYVQSTDEEAKYDLHFVEFDDQGWLHNPVHAHSVIKKIQDEVRTSKKDSNKSEDSNPDNHALVVVYVHGWKHNASTDDSNVRQFRLLLRSIAMRERIKFGVMDAKPEEPKRKVIGVYVGWRGASVQAKGIEELSFWDRKKAAIQVAQGSVREFLSRIDVIADVTNKDWYEKQVAQARATVESGIRAALAEPLANAPPKPVRTLFIGHSFGGHLLFTAFSGGVIRDVVEFQERHKKCEDDIRRKLVEKGNSAPPSDAPKSSDDNKENILGPTVCDSIPLRRQGDLLILLNPAIEALQYEPLHVATRHMKQYPRYVAPIFVSVTSDADTALRWWFKLGRIFSTRFEAYPDDDRTRDRKKANLTSLGYMDRYLTHSMCSRDSSSPECRREHLSDTPFCEAYPKPDDDNEKKRIDVEKNETKRLREEWIDNIKSLGENYWKAERKFCGDIRLVTHEGTPRFSPVWNIRTDDSLIAGHTKIAQPAFIAVIRQLYSDSGEAGFAEPARRPPGRVRK